jgi:hypothetical protein
MSDDLLRYIVTVASVTIFVLLVVGTLIEGTSVVGTIDAIGGFVAFYLLWRFRHGPSRP